MIKAITKFNAKDEQAASELKVVFEELLVKTPKEQCVISYDIMSVTNSPFSFYIIEEWESEAALTKHADNVAKQGYIERTRDLLTEGITTDIVEILKN